MTASLLLLAAFACAAFWWLLRQGIASKPWLETGLSEEASNTGRPTTPAAGFGLLVMMVVGATLMTLLLSAYGMRMSLADWNPTPLPRLLWGNTAILVAASFALGRAVRAQAAGRREKAARDLLLGAAGGIGFLAGQIVAWGELARSGYLPASNPADAFFYLITAVHGLHVLGGLAALGWAAAQLGRDPSGEPSAVAQCAAYWHFLLASWIVLFAALSSSPSFDWLAAICAAPFK